MAAINRALESINVSRFCFLCGADMIERRAFVGVKCIVDLWLLCSVWVWKCDGCEAVHQDHKLHAFIYLVG